MPPITYSDQEAAEALMKVIGGSKWEAVALADGFLAGIQGSSLEEAARVVFERGPLTLKKSRERLEEAQKIGFLRVLTPRTKTGSAENPITKLFPATITEQRFLERLDRLQSTRPTVKYSDDRESGHGLTDFTLREGDLELPVNIKTAGTRFERALQLVGLDPNDSIPIPAYKAHAAVEQEPNLVYVVSVDYDLIGKLSAALPKLLDRAEAIVWDLLNRHKGTHLRNAEDAFVFTAVKKYWTPLAELCQESPFHVISARKAVRVLQEKPRRTPGIGLRAWGTGASAEVNVHISIRDETTAWEAVSDRITTNGIIDIVKAVNRKRVEEVYDPEI